MSNAITYSETPKVFDIRNHEITGALSQTAPSHAEDLAAPISGQFRSSPFYVAIGSITLSGVLAIVLTVACYLALPESAAQQLASQLQLALLGTGSFGTGVGIVGMVKRGLSITDGKKQVELMKTAAQYPQQPVPATVNVAGDVNTVPAPAVDAALPPTRREYTDEVQNYHPDEFAFETRGGYPESVNENIEEVIED